MKILEIKNISKNFNKKNKTHKVLANVSLDVDSGSFISIIGKNGSGKTTLAKIITNTIEPDEGIIEKNFKNIGYVSSNKDSFFGRLSVYQNLEFFFRLRGGSLSEFKTSLEKYLDLLEIDKDIINTKFFYLSSGEKRKISLLRGFMHDPDLIILDEALDFLDYKYKLFFERFLKLEILNERKKTILSITHDIEFALRMSKSFLVLKDKNSILLHKNKSMNVASILDTL